VPEPSPQDQVTRLASGYWHTQAIYVAAKLGIADLLAGGPRSADELAASTGANAHALYRLLRTLASLGILAVDDRRFVLTSIAECLRTGMPDSVRSLCVIYHPVSAAALAKKARPRKSEPGRGVYLRGRASARFNNRTGGFR
jgi:hypothetical protein